MLVHSACIFFYSISVALYRYYFGIDLYIQMLSSYFHFYNDNTRYSNKNSSYESYKQ